MELQVNKFYKTQNGIKAFVAAVCPTGPNLPFCAYPFMGWTEFGSVRSPVAWNARGSVNYPNGSGVDIVGDWFALELGKTYKTRDGRRVLINSIIDDIACEGSVVCDTMRARIWHVSGKYAGETFPYSDLDIVGLA
jgi:hypothetical protein